MTENTTTTNGVNLPAPVKDMRETLPALLEKHIPWMEAKHKVADDLLDTIPDEITTDDEAEDVTAKLAGVRSVGTAISDKRMEMTRITDAFKTVLMDYERPFDTKSDKSKYNLKKKVLENYQQKKLEERRRQEQEALKRKDLENLKVDLKAKMRENLTQMLIDVVKRVDAGSRSYFETLTVEKFDEGAEKYKNNKPKLKPGDYEGCFIRPVDPIGSKNIELMSQVDYARYVVEVQQEETFDKWNTAFVESVAPIINEWRAKMPDLKADKIKLAQAQTQSAEEAERVRKEQQEKSEAEAKERQQKLDAVATEQKQQIQADANLDKMSNAFVEQNALGKLTEAGNVKLVLKFTDPKETPKALLAIMYHVLSHDDFPGIQKRDSKTKKLSFDEKGRPIYIEEVQRWIDFFLANCNADVPGTQVFEDAKVIVRK